MSFCTHCGSPLNDEMLFCSKCGHRNLSINAQKAASPPRRTTKSRSGGFFILIVLVVLVVVAFKCFSAFGSPVTDDSQSSQGGNLKAPILDTLTQLSGSWTQEPLYLRHGASTYAYELSSPVKNCTELTLNITVFEYTGYPFDEWYLYARDLDGNWDHIAMFTLEENIALNETLKFPLKFAAPESFDALAIAHVADGYWYNINWDMYYTNVKTK